MNYSKDLKVETTRPLQAHLTHPDFMDAAVLWLQRTKNL